MLLPRSSRVDAVNELYKPRNERNKGRQTVFQLDDEREGGIDRSREIDLTERRDPFAEPSLLFTIDNDLESGAV